MEEYSVVVGICRYLHYIVHNKKNVSILVYYELKSKKVGKKINKNNFCVVGVVVQK